MTRLHHLPLFHPRLVRDRMRTLDKGLFALHQPTISTWLAHLRSGDLDDQSEVKLHGGFLERIFGDVLGYHTMATAQKGRWEIEAERRVRGGGAADGAIGLFEGRNAQVLAPIELKGAAQFLEHAKGRSLTPIQQGWDYANKTPESRWIIVSNYRETRLYAKSRGPGAYELFLLQDLASEEGFLRFVALLGRDALLSGPKFGESPLYEMLLASERTEREITERLYAKYRGIRAQLFDELRRKHSNLPTDELLGYAQTILDRVLFVAFAEDRGLIPPSSLAKAIEYRDPYNPRPVWHNLLSIFRGIDQGNAALNIPLYDGGLFREIPQLAELELSDALCGTFKELGEYDFAEDVSVDVLGHVFEQSISDLEQLRSEAGKEPESARTPTLPSTGTQKSPSRRKVEGIFYTPPFVTSYLVRETLGRVLGEAWDRAGVERAQNKADRITAWEAYRSQLRLIRVLDPSCGSGAFLIATFDALAHEFERVNRTLAELQGAAGQITLFDLTRTVLNENLFGVDKSGESVEITKLSLWLKTAERNKRLTFLDRNIRRGNSVVSDPLVDPWAFDWTSGRTARPFLEPDPPTGADAEAIAARWRDGFDVVIGNPPYVRQELLSAYKTHWQSSFTTYDGMADLFVYFFERGLTQLKVGGRLGFIVSNKWLRGGYAETLRAHLAKQCVIETLVDFGHAPIFPDADAFPCIITLRKLLPKPDTAVRVTLYPREELGKEQLASYVEAHAFPMTQSALPKAGWSLSRPEEQTLLDKLRRTGVPLGMYAPLKPSYGVKTGCNEAFLIDNAEKERLCREDPRSAEVLKKFLRGQDIARWSPEWNGMWLLLLPSSSDGEASPWSKLSHEAEAEAAFAAALPAVYRHLKRLEEKLRKRTDQGRFWWELRSCAYYERFAQPKLIYQVIQFHPAYAYDTDGYFLNDKGFLLPSADHWLLAVLNSPAMWWHNWRYLVHLKDEALSPAGDKMISVPIPMPSAEQRDKTEQAVAQSVALTRSIQLAKADVLDLLRLQYGIAPPGQRLADFEALGSEDFLREVTKRRDKQKDFPTSALRELRTLFDKEVPGILVQRSKLLGLEKQIAEQVHAAYKLTAEELAVMAETQPPRMPPGF